MAPYQAFTPYWTLLNRAATAIGSIDAAHPVGTVISFPSNDTLTALNTFAQNLDFVRWPFALALPPLFRASASPLVPSACWCRPLVVFR